MSEEDETFRQAVLVFTVGMLLPVLPVILARERLVSTLDYRTFLVLLALGFGLTAFVLVELLALDRPTFLFVAVVWPWVVFFAGLFLVLLVNEGTQVPEGPAADAFYALVGDSRVWGKTPDEPSRFRYGAAFTLAGVGAVVLSAVRRRLTDSTPGRRADR